MIPEAMGTLSGLRVLDFSRVLAGPFCTMMLADLGADVIKIEHPARGDDTRAWGPPWLGDDEDGQSAYFLSVNRNKRSLTLNIKTPGGQDLARQLAAQSHILVENFKAGQMPSFGLGYDDLRAVNPGLVYCSVTGFGQTGPYRDRPGYDYVIQAMSGLMSITGPEDGPPYKVGVAISDVFAGLFAATSILAAVRHSERTGQGQYIDVALLDTQIAALVNVASNFLVSGQTPPRYGNQHPNIVPYQTFSAADGDFVVAVGNDGQFARLCDLIDRPEVATDPRCATNPARVENRAWLVPELQAIFARRPAAEWVDRLLGAGIPAGPINAIPAALDDPHVAARGLVCETATLAGDRLRMVGPPVRMAPNPAQVRAAPPRLGEHTDEILRDVLGLDAETVAAYRAEGCI
jgi:crotonobetainyl-CoA:carnitine CoA-transferase CaiB-like acyl-CoA transferase